MRTLISSRALLTFNTDLDHTRTLRISDPADDLTTQDVIAATDPMIAANVFEPDSGVLVSLARADVIEDFMTKII